MSTKTPIHNTISSASIKDAHNTNDAKDRYQCRIEAEKAAEMERIQAIVRLRFKNAVKTFCK